MHKLSSSFGLAANNCKPETRGFVSWKRAEKATQGLTAWPNEARVCWNKRGKLIPRSKMQAKAEKGARR